TKRIPSISLDSIGGMARSSLRAQCRNRCARERAHLTPKNGTRNKSGPAGDEKGNQAGHDGIAMGLSLSLHRPWRGSPDRKKEARLEAGLRFDWCPIHATSYSRIPRW